MAQDSSCSASEWVADPIGCAMYEQGYQAQQIGNGAPADYEVIKTATTAASVRNVTELQARIKAVGGALVVGPNTTDYLVAINNSLRFSVTRNAAGQFVIRESNNYQFVILAAVGIGLLMLLSSR